MLKRGTAVAAAIAVLTLAPVATHLANAAGDTFLSARSLLTRLVDPVAALQPLPPGLRVVQHSSHDRRGANGDTSSFDPLVAPVALPEYIRQEAGGFVLFDGETRPRLDVAATALFTGHTAGFPAPLVGDAARSTGGSYSYVPLCFATSLKIRATGGAPGTGWYQLEALVGPHGAAVDERPATPGMLTAATSALGRVERHPAAAPRSSLRQSLSAGQRATASVGGSGIVRFVRVRVEPFTIETLQALQLRVTADGGPRPQIDLPLAAVFGDGLEVRTVKSLAFGEDPAAHAGYLALPIPFAHGLRIELVAGRPAVVALDAWTGTSPTAGERLYGERRVETTTVGRDFTILDAVGSGRMVSMVVDIFGHDGSGAFETYLEGDDRVYVDGSRSPSVYGTGTEDNFNAGFYYANGAFTLPTHGAGPPGSAAPERATRSQYRVFGGDAVVWSASAHYGMEHGAGDENVERVASTTFSYRAPLALTPTDALAVGDAGSEHAHEVRGRFDRRHLRAFFEGDSDGNLSLPSVALAGAPNVVPPELSPEAVAADGLVFSGPIAFVLRTRAPNCGVVLRRLLDRRSRSQRPRCRRRRPARRPLVGGTHQPQQAVDGG